MSDLVRVLIVDDDALVRAGLSMMLREFDDIEIVAAVSDGAEAQPAVNQHRPDVVLMDIRMRDLDGITATESMRRRPDPPEVIILTTFDTDSHIVRAIQVGTSGFLLKHTPPHEIAQAFRAVAAGEPILSPQVMRKMMSYVAESQTDPRAEQAGRLLSQLTAAEHAVATLIGEGRTNSDIAGELSVSVATVKAYVSRMLTKLELNNRVQIALLVHNASTDG